MFSHLKTAACGFVALGLLAGTASADTFLKYGEVEGWKVFIDQEKKSCLIEAAATLSFPEATAPTDITFPLSFQPE